MLNTAGQANGEGYIMLPASVAADECQRLDDMHAGFRQYFGGQLCLGPIAEERPGKIIDFGCGSGAWAIQAAVQFPDAEVLAVDISPLPDRTLPSNVVFARADVTKELNFDPKTFDIVHCCLVVTHIQNARDAIERVARLVRPGGLLLLEDMDMSRLRETAGPTVHRIVSRFMESMAARGGDPEILCPRPRLSSEHIGAGGKDKCDAGIRRFRQTVLWPGCQ
ncbi:S-adenosyl-L-methionine-dependent methyltransferase [Mycena latifolia]|nr:S-adenosyl-L-methionine-dependent methyltransferase [Mycena latifolia]